MMPEIIAPVDDWGEWPAEYGYRDSHQDQLTQMSFWRAKAKPRRWWRRSVLFVSDRTGQ